MALADYHDRAAVAVSQAIAGFDPDAFRAMLLRTAVGVSFGPQAANSCEGRALLDLSVRLLARLYPTLVFPDSAPAAVREELAVLARAINPRIDIASSGSTITLGVGADAAGPSGTIFVGSDAWWTMVSTTQAQPVGDSDNPLGAGAAACLGVGNVFRAMFLPGSDRADHALRFSLARLISGDAVEPRLGGLHDDGRTALAGAGAIGNAVIWCLARMPLRGCIHVVDGQCLDLGNLQRYVLALRDAVGREKVGVGADQLKGELRAVAHPKRWAEFVGANGYAWDRVLVGLDTPGDRRLLQGTLPKWIANGWTQIGELGLSTHVLDDPTAPCLACLYLTRGTVPNEDEQVAAALGLATDLPHLMIVRDLLYRGAPAPEALLREIGQAKTIEWSVLEPYLARPLRELYVQGVCGGGIVRLGSQGPTAQEFQVPLAHQSALAGVLVAAAYVLDVAGVTRDHRQLVRIDPMRRFPTEPARLVAKDDRGLCFCTDPVAIATYQAKYPGAAPQIAGKNVEVPAAGQPQPKEESR